MTNILGKYVNGNYNVTICDDGTKIRETDDESFIAEFPESIDIKITNRCHNNCPFCHEDSNCDGEHGDILSPSFIDNLNSYTEASIGGGNPLEHPDLIPFLEKLKSLNIIPSITIRQNDFMDNIAFLTNLTNRKLIYGIGVSLVKPDPEFIKAIKGFPNAVIHVINGVVSIEDLLKLSGKDLKLLILGYKEVRRGRSLLSSKEYKKRVVNLKSALYTYLPVIMMSNMFKVISFDNLAILQLKPEKYLSKEDWNSFYMGDDGIDGKMTSASMYVDMVKREFAKNSCDMKRYPITDNITDMYKYLKEKC